MRKTSADMMERLNSRCEMLDCVYNILVDTQLCDARAPQTFVGEAIRLFY